jgi:uncharacterized membrane protein YccC
VRGAAVRRDIIHSAVLAIAALVSYWLATHALARVHSLGHVDDLLGGMWSVIATVFVYRASYRRSAAAATARSSATLVAFALCLLYLMLFPFHPWGLALLIGLGALVVTLLGRPDDVVTTTITVTVVLVVAALSPQHAWEQPILRLFDTAVGIAIGLAFAWVARELTTRASGLAIPPRIVQTATSKRELGG